MGIITLQGFLFNNQYNVKQEDVFFVAHFRIGDHSYVVPSNMIVYFHNYLRKLVPLASKKHVLQFKLNCEYQQVFPLDPKS